MQCCAAPAPSKTKHRVCDQLRTGHHVRDDTSPSDDAAWHLRPLDCRGRRLRCSAASTPLSVASAAHRQAPEMAQEIERPRKLGVPRSRKKAGARCDRSNAVINAAKTILARCGADWASAVSFWPACMALGSDGRRAILPNGAPPMGARRGPAQNEGSPIKCGAFDVRWKCIFRADSALYIDGGEGIENFISSPVRDMMQSCTPN